ncbi:hypothetical protein SAMN05421847_0870 [Halpernia humi]|uniref:Uncharacterized protein n=1 Tax=Halpernia humi TaxID=493375 RepID=A0A1H5UPY2_9FLAO|nr:hypothetical protein [Halpernia humi]SEF77086.1 hypothetical protein SAMN05421847_0870 [Halpernia humi]
MDINAEKIELAQEILKIQDVEIISKLKKSLKNFIKQEKIKPMSLEQFYAEIDESLRDSENDNVFTTSEVKDKIKEWTSR